MSAVHRELRKQKESNKNGLRHFADFESHRRCQTEFILSPETRKRERLCVLGAGNCYDLEIDRLATEFDEVHLVDIDRRAISGARGRLPGHLADKVHLHAPVDISGVNDQLEAWRKMRVTPESMLNIPERATNSVARQLPGTFDCVVSTCLASQLLLTCRHVMGERHPLLEAGIITLLVTHLRVLAALTAEEGTACFVSDVSSDEIAPLHRFDDAQDGLEFVASLAQKNQIFNYLDPDLVVGLARQDPILAAGMTICSPAKAWLWTNGPRRTFLVYAARMIRRESMAVTATETGL